MWRCHWVEPVNPDNTHPFYFFKEGVVRYVEQEKLCFEPIEDEL